MDWAVEIEHLNKTYPENHVTALDDVSIAVKPNELFGLVGPDGAGKSTLFNILTTLLLPDSGHVTVLGMDVIADYKKVRSTIGYLPGVFSLYPDLTVEENLIFFATMYKSKISENMSIIKPIWRQLLPFKKRRAGKLSGGMKQKLALCCALIHKPTILFLDEPTTGVDPVSRKEFWEILKGIQQQDITVVVSTPYMDEATLCDRIALIQDGRIIEVATPSQIIDNFEGSLYTLTTDNIFGLLEIMKQCTLHCNYYPNGDQLHIVFYEDAATMASAFQQFLQEHQIEFRNMKRIAPNIEDCFIELVKPK
ncbi:MAG: ABC transporter ATP-binding protein [Bacteroidales bacterium]|nr:ABC transporter ATP-binding protein [Bacteroidales bacterium]